MKQITRTLSDLCGRFRSDRRGNVAITFALSMPLVVGGLGFGAETGYWYYQQLRLQQALHPLGDAPRVGSSDARHERIVDCDVGEERLSAGAVVNRSTAKDEIVGHY